jgi:hypothetical protein
MLEQFRLWYLRNYTEITWFLIGFLVMTGFTQIGREDYLNALISWGIAAVNYWFVKK